MATVSRISGLLSFSKIVLQFEKTVFFDNRWAFLGSRPTENLLATPVEGEPGSEKAEDPPFGGKNQLRQEELIIIGSIYSSPRPF